MSELENERLHLKEVLHMLDERKQFVVDKLESVKFMGDQDMAKTLNEIYDREYFNIKKHYSSPYFAKIIFKDDKEATDDVMYIGKVGFQDKFSNEIVIDWRAPVASLYYDSEVGRASYNSPEGLKEGQLKLKRHTNIENCQLKDFVDSDSMTNDELLKPYLNASADKRLKSIVATIQKEQNTIIRAPKSNLIVQGVAGSGKTTVALHRLSYLIYQMGKFTSTNDFMIIAPNNLFLNYISQVLPELDTGNVTELTIEELTKLLIKEKFKIVDKNETLKDLTEGKLPKKYLKFKTSLEYKNLIDEFWVEEEREFLPEKFSYRGIELYSRDELYNVFKSIKLGNIQTDLVKMCDNVANKLKHIDYREMLIDKLIERANLLGEDISLQEKWDLNRLFEKGGVAFFKKQTKTKNFSVIETYKKFLQKIGKNEEYKELSIDSLTLLKKNEITFEDIPSFIYLATKLYPCDNYDNICNVVIDEAQDLGLFHFYAIKKLFKNALFDLYGDMNQAIFSYSSINNWKEVEENIFNSNNNYFELIKSYRTTIEIMDTANLVANVTNIVKGMPVIRHGDKVKAIRYNDGDFNKTLTDIVKVEEKKYSTVAILCKTGKECDKIKNLLLSNGIKCKVLSDKENVIEGVVILTIQEAKGLEFDSVILNDVSKENFDRNSDHDMRLLYVGLTRAMHNMIVLSRGEETEALKPIFENA